MQMNRLLMRDANRQSENGWNDGALALNIPISLASGLLREDPLKQLSLASHGLDLPTLTAANGFRSETIRGLGFEVSIPAIKVSRVV